MIRVVMIRVVMIKVVMIRVVMIRVVMIIRVIDDDKGDDNRAYYTDGRCGHGGHFHIVIDDKHPVTNTLIVSSLPPSGHSVFSAARCSLLRPHSPSRPLRRTQPQRHAHVALNRLLVRTRQRAQLLLEINLPISRKGILQTLPQILFFSLHALAVTNQIPLLRPHRIQNRL